MVCYLSCAFYFVIAAAVIALLIKAYFYFTTGRHTIKQSLKGKVVVITGATAGIGRETVRELAKKDATIHVLARDLNKANRVIDELKQDTGNQDIHIHQVDLSNFESVRTFAKKFLETKSPIHMLINNAGLYPSAKKMTVDGNEESTQANHLSHFLLTNLLLDRIKESKPSRIVNLSSMGHMFVTRKAFDVHDLNYEKSSNQWNHLKAYCTSKLLNILFTRELARRLYGSGVTTNCLHPGGVRTELSREGTWTNPVAVISKISSPFYKTANEGAQTTLYVATAEELEHTSGHYFADCRLERMTTLAADDLLAKELWEESEKLTGKGKKN